MTFTRCQKNSGLKRMKTKAIIGIIKEIDKLGRIVIPKEFRERFGLTEKVEVVATELGILIKNPEYKLVKIDKEDRSYDEQKESDI